MKYRYILRIAAGIILIMAMVFIHNAIAIYQFSQQNQTRVADCAIVAGAGVSGKTPSPVFRPDWIMPSGFTNNTLSARWY